MARKNQVEVKTKYVKCIKCNGKGEIKENVIYTCPDCRGTGQYKIGYTFTGNGIAIDGDTLK